MNFLLLARDEIGIEGRATLRGRRAEHVRQVLRGTVGQTLRAGVIDGPITRATIVSMTNEEVQVAVDPTGATVASSAADVLLLAVPRPKVLLRLYEHAAALGFGHIVLFRSWRVEKSHLQSTALQAHVQREHLLLGLEQAGRTRLPTVRFFPLFKPMVEDHLDAMQLPSERFCAHPTASNGTRDLAGSAGAFTLAIGPDGGFLPYEVEALAAHGFLPISCGPHPLRTETALAVLTGQLALLRERASVTP